MHKKESAAGKKGGKTYGDYFNWAAENHEYPLRVFSEYCELENLLVRVTSAKTKKAISSALREMRVMIYEEIKTFLSLPVADTKATHGKKLQQHGADDQTRSCPTDWSLPSILPRRGCLSKVRILSPDELWSDGKGAKE